MKQLHRHKCIQTVVKKTEDFELSSSINFVRHLEGIESGYSCTSFYWRHLSLTH